MMRLHASGLGSGAKPAAAGRLKKREERGMGTRPPSIITTSFHPSELAPPTAARGLIGEGGDEFGDPRDGARSPETTAPFGSYASVPTTASPLLTNKASSALWSSASSSSSAFHGGHGELVATSSETNSSTWRDVIIGGGAGHDELPLPSGSGSSVTTAPPLGSTVTPTPAASKRKKTKKEVFVCHEPNCGKQFPRSFALRRHMRIHTGNKPYACDYDGCTQRFNTSGNLSRHKRIHSGERPYPCIFSTCGKKFNTSTKLKRHMRIHFPEGQNVFRCVGLSCSWSCDNYKEFAAHQKLQHNIIVGAGLEAVSAAAAATIAAAAGTLDHHHGVQDADEAGADAHGYSSTSYMYGYSKSPSLPLPPPPPPSSSTQSRKRTSSSSNSSSVAAASGSAASSSALFTYDSSFASLSGLARETKAKSQQQDADHFYGSADHHRRGKSASGSYTLPSTSFPSADAAAATSHYASSRGSAGVSSLYESSSTLAISSENTSSYGAPSLRSSSLFGHALRHEDSSFKSEGEGGHYDHQPHALAAPAAHHHILRPPPPSSHHDHDGMKFSVPPPMNPAAPEFTGEELSVVLELMKDSYY